MKFIEKRSLMQFNTFSFAFANFFKEAINGGQVQLPKLMIKGTLLEHISCRLIFEAESTSVNSIFEGISSPTLM